MSDHSKPTRRDLLAAACLPAIYQHITQMTDRAAELAYEQADEMLRVSEQRIKDFVGLQLNVRMEGGGGPAGHSFAASSAAQEKK